MTEYLIQDSTLTAIGDAIRTKTGKTNTFSPNEMVSEIINIETGTELNFDVVGGTTAPSNPTENTIWVNTNVPITTWYFSATQPTTLTNGEVWFVVGVSSEAPFNGLKDNNITIYPIASKQYQFGSLVDVTAKTYQNGKWVDWVFILGLDSSNWTKNPNYASDCTISYSNNTITITSAPNPTNIYEHSGAYNKTAMDLTNYSQLRVTGTWTFSGNGEITIGVVDMNLNNAVTTTVNNFTGTKELDISSLSGKYYFNIQNRTGTDSSATSSITEISLK